MGKNYVLYIDESGKATFGEASQFFVLAGLAVEDKADVELSSYFGFLKRRHKLAADTAFHAYDIFENKAHQSYVRDAQKCAQIAESVVEFLANAPVKIWILAIDKNDIKKLLKVPEGYNFGGPGGHKEDKEIAYEILARLLFFKFAKFLKHNRARGSVVAESRRDADKLLFSSYLASQDPQKFAGRPASIKSAETARDNTHSICFAGKASLKEGLELADIISYCAYNEIIGRYPVARYDRRGVKKMWEKIKTQTDGSGVYRATMGDMRAAAPDRIHEIAKRVEKRLSDFSDLVNPTRGRSSRRGTGRGASSTPPI